MLTVKTTQHSFSENFFFLLILSLPVLYMTSEGSLHLKFPFYIPNTKQIASVILDLPPPFGPIIDVNLKKGPM